MMGLVAGLGTWATHFVAMIAFEPHLPSAYQASTTVASLVIAVVVMTSGTLVAFRSAGLTGRLLGGAMVGAGVVAMHYTGMAALSVPGRLVWDPAYVAASLAIASVMAAGAFAIAREHERGRPLFAAAAMLTVAIAGLHFTGMAAVHIEVDPRIVVPDQGISSGWLALSVSASALLVLCIGAVGIAVDLRARRGEADRLRDFADAAVEGLAICENDVVTDANRSFCQIAGRPLSALKGHAFTNLLSADTQALLLAATAEESVEGDIITLDGHAAPVSILKRSLTGSDGRARTVFAVRDLREQREAEHRIRFLAHHDPLTGLANRLTFSRALSDACDRARTVGGPVVVFCIDLDRFKNVNDLYGHFAGDEVLVEAARRMRDTLEDGDLLARLGGDEFAILCTRSDLPPETVAERVVEALSQDVTVAGGNRAVLGASVGFAVGPADGDDPERLMSNADIALYRAKYEGRGRFRRFEKAMDTQVRERHALAADLRGAIARHELKVHYQPQMKVSSIELVGFEALVRWQHPKRGLVPPSDFIPLAEESGQIVALGEWVLRTACAEAASWTNPLHIAVNLSPIQFQQPNLPDLVHDILIQTGLPAHRLELEVTESVIIKDMSRALGMLRRLKSLGVRIAMDDFGTGSSSLATLQAFPFDKIKIDRSFVSKVESHPQAAVIVRAVLGLGRNLGMSVVAEGVETQNQLRFLSAEACEEVQGYLLGRPEPIQTYASDVHFSPREAAA